VEVINSFISDVTVRSLNDSHIEMVEASGLKKYGVEVTFGAVTSPLNAIKI
jgi:hypothetical protein